MNQQHFNEFLRGYITALLWSSGNGEEHESFEGFTLSNEAQAECEKDCKQFMEVAAVDLAEYVERIDTQGTCTPWEHAGHDFWLTRAGHGVGFWDRGLDELGERLAALCGHGAQFPNVDPYLGDDQKVYLL